MESEPSLGVAAEQKSPLRGSPQKRKRMEGVPSPQNSPRRNVTLQSHEEARRLIMKQTSEGYLPAGPLLMLEEKRK